MKHLGYLAYLISLSPVIGADNLPVGTWVRREAQEGVHITMKVEAAGAGLKLTYTISGGQTPVNQVLTVLTQLDGKDAPTMMDGKPTGQTMAIRSIDGRHTEGVVKFQGKQISTSKSEISPDGKVLKIENTAPGADGKPAVTVEYWDRK